MHRRANRRQRGKRRSCLYDLARLDLAKHHPALPLVACGRWSGVLDPHDCGGLLRACRFCTTIATRKCFPRFVARYVDWGPDLNRWVTCAALGEPPGMTIGGVWAGAYGAYNWAGMAAGMAAGMGWKGGAILAF